MLAAAIAAIGPIAKGIAGAATFVESVTPKLEDEVVVEVLGEPGASKRTLYFLALSTAYSLARPGIVGRFFTPPPSLLMLEYDAADDWVRVTLKYKVGALDFVNQNIGASFLGPVGVGVNAVLQVFGAAQLVSQMPILNGPAETVIGGLPVLPVSFLNVPLPLTGVPNAVDPVPKVNPFIGKTILTNEGRVNINGQMTPTPNPKPSGDNRSRGSVETNSPGTYLPGLNWTVPGSTEKYLVPLVFAALSAPGSQNDMTFTPPQQGHNGAG